MNPNPVLDDVEGLAGNLRKFLFCTFLGDGICTTTFILYSQFPFVPPQRKETDEVSSSGYSSSFNAEYYPVQGDTMDTEDYELYDPRVHARPTRIVQPRVATKVKPREVQKSPTIFLFAFYLFAFDSEETYQINTLFESSIYFFFHKRNNE